MPPTTGNSADLPITIFRNPVVKDSFPASKPIATLRPPVLTQHAAALPRNILFVPEVSLFPAARPITTLQEPVIKSPEAA